MERKKVIYALLLAIVFSFVKTECMEETLQSSIHDKMLVSFILNQETEESGGIHRYKCEICRGEFSYKNNLNRHIRYIHRGEK